MGRDSNGSNGGRDKIKSQQKTVIHLGGNEGSTRDKELESSNPRVLRDKSAGSSNSNNNNLRYVYEARGQTVEIYSSNLKCLSPEAYLDDSIMKFFTAYLLNELCTAANARTIHVFDNYFHKRLCETFPQNSEKYVDQAKWKQLNKWFSGVDIFEKNFLIFPICQEEHWYAVIVCYPGEVADVDQSEIPMPQETGREESPGPKPIPGIIVMDSLGMNKRLITKEIREFLDFEWRTRLTTIKDFSHHSMEQFHPRLPTQRNAYDCGIYTLAYLKAFAPMPEKFYRLVRKSTPSWGDEKKDLPQNLLALVDRCLSDCSRESLKNLIHKCCKKSQ